MKLIKKDKVMVITGKDKGKSGEVLVVLSKTNQVIETGVNVAKRHTKPSATNPKGGIVELNKPVKVSNVMILDPASGKPARIGYILNKSGKKERIFKVSKFRNKKVNAAKPQKAKAAKS